MQSVCTVSSFACVRFPLDNYLSSSDWINPLRWTLNRRDIVFSYFVSSCPTQVDTTHVQNELQ